MLRLHVCDNKPRVCIITVLVFGVSRQYLQLICLYLVLFVIVCYSKFNELYSAALLMLQYYNHARHNKAVQEFMKKKHAKMCNYSWWIKRITLSYTIQTVSVTLS